MHALEIPCFPSLQSCASENCLNYAFGSVLVSEIPCGLETTRKRRGLEAPRCIAFLTPLQSNPADASPEAAVPVLLI